MQFFASVLFISDPKATTYCDQAPVIFLFESHFVIRAIASTCLVAVIMMSPKTNCPLAEEIFFENSPEDFILLRLFLIIYR
jgi:hypothetical protein